MVEILKSFLAKEACRQALLFLFVGFGSSLSYSFTIVVLVELLGAGELLATAAGFAVGTAVSYVGNMKLTFNGEHAAGSLVKFIIVTGIGLILNIGIMHLALVAGLPYLCGIIGVLTTVPAFNFLGHKLWSFRK